MCSDLSADCQASWSPPRGPQGSLSGEGSRLGSWHIEQFPILHAGGTRSLSSLAGRWHCPLAQSTPGKAVPTPGASAGARVGWGGVACRPWSQEDSIFLGVTEGRPRSDAETQAQSFPRACQRWPQRPASVQSASAGRVLGSLLRGYGFSGGNSSVGAQRGSRRTCWNKRLGEGRKLQLRPQNEEEGTIGLPVDPGSGRALVGGGGSEKAHLTKRAECLEDRDGNFLGA